MKAALGALAVALVLCPAALAKGPTKLTVWGASGSVTVELERNSGLARGGWPLEEVPPPAPFYVVGIDVGHDIVADVHLLLYVPSEQRIAGNGVVDGLEWFPVGRRGARTLDATAAGLRPYEPAGRWPPRLASVERIARFARPQTSDRSGWWPLAVILAAVGTFAAAAIVLVTGSYGLGAADRKLRRLRRGGRSGRPARTPSG